MSMASVTLRWVNHFTRNKSWHYRHVLGKIRQLFECSTTWPLYHGVLHRKIVPRILFSQYFQQSPSGRCTGFCRNRGQFLLFLFLMAHLSTSLLLPLMSIRLVFTLPASFVMKTTLRSTSNFWGWLKTSRMSPTASEAYTRYWKYCSTRMVIILLFVQYLLWLTKNCSAKNPAISAGVSGTSGVHSFTAHLD